MEKPTSHPLWAEFVEFMGIHPFLDYDAFEFWWPMCWKFFLAGAVAKMKAMNERSGYTLEDL